MTAAIALQRPLSTRPKPLLALVARPAPPPPLPKTLPPPDFDAAPASTRRLRAPVPALDDTELLVALRNGDPSAATAFHDRVRPQVARTVYRLLGRGDVDHEDVIQLALIELVYTIDRYRGECSLDSWTTTLTAHVVFKQIRRRQTERRIFSGTSAEDVAVAAPTETARELVQRDLLARIRRHLDRIDANRAWTFMLHDVCGHDLKEVAQITGVTVAAAQTRLVRGRRELHESIAHDPELCELMGRTSKSA